MWSPHRGNSSRPDPHTTALRLKLTRPTPALSSAQFQHPHTHRDFWVCSVDTTGGRQHSGLPQPPGTVCCPDGSPGYPLTQKKFPSFAPLKFHPAPEISNATVIFHGVFLKKKTPLVLWGNPQAAFCAASGVGVLMVRPALGCPCTD